MSANNHALRRDKILAAPVLGPVSVPTLASAVAASSAVVPRVPAIRVMPLEPVNSMRRFARVPTHAVGVFPEQREYPRASLRLPLRLRGVNGRSEDFPITLVTRDISSSGVFFLCPRKIGLDTQIELEVVLVSRPMGRGNVVIVSKARVTRVEAAAVPGWFGIAASFDDLEFDRDDDIPSRPFSL
jgi:PilZ domain-containing protein